MKISQIVLIVVLFIILLYIVEQLKAKKSVINFAYIDQRQYVDSISEHTTSQEISSVNKTSKFKKSIDALIKSNRIEDAIRQVIRFTETKAHEHHNEVLLLSCRWEDLSKNKRLGTLDNSEIQRENNQLVLSLLELAGKCV